LSLRINFLQPTARSLVIPKFSPGNATAELTGAGEPIPARFERILELTIPYADLGWRPRDGVQFFVQLLQGSVELERHPAVGALSFAVPDEQFEVENWRV
jgi:hypothetical protein